MTISLINFEAFLLILVRITAFIYVAPFFSLRSVPQRVKVGLSIFFSLVLFQVIPSLEVNYQGIIGFSGLLIGEALAGIIIGFFANISYYILSFTGQSIDMQIGYSMVNEYDPISNTQVTITSNFYSYLVMLMMLVTNMHHYIILAMVDTFKVIPLGGIVIRPNMYIIMLDYMKEYFIIGFRIQLPIFAGILVVNAILAILAKVAPQLNMFVIGLQLKVFVGLAILLLMTSFTPMIADYIFNEMMVMMKAAISTLS